jgi:L-amino acid N-acyltransferase YncA
VKRCSSSSLGRAVLPVHSRFVIIREAQAADWPKIYPFFRSIVDAGATYAYPENLSSDDAQKLWMEVPPGLTVVAESGEHILGSAKMSPNRPARGAHVATASFMVDPIQREKGVGRALAEHMLQWARDHNYRAIQFNAVVETNTSAVHLWQSLGFTVLTTVPEAFDHAEFGLVGLHVMYLSLRGDV